MVVLLFTVSMTELGPLAIHPDKNRVKAEASPMFFCMVFTYESEMRLGENI